MNRKSALDKVREKRLIFTVTTGRSGTAYLSSIFGYARNAHSYHEPAPEYVQVLREAQTEPSCAHRFIVDEKIPAIAGDSAHIYIETSHLVCKGFLESWLDLGIVPDLIIHRRSARDVSLSLLKMGTIPGRTDKGLKFYLSPADPNVLGLAGWESLHDYQLCFWYCLEIEKRAQRYKRLFHQHGARIAETTLAELKTFAGLEKCFSDLALQAKVPAWLTRLRFLRGSGVKVNQSKETKKDVIVPDNLSELEQEVIDKIDDPDVQEWLPKLSSGVA